MEVSQKEQNRSKWKSSARRGRGRGRGRGGVTNSQSHKAAHGPDLDSNYDRYLGSDEEAGSDTGDGLRVRQSQGADLQQLLAESEQFYGQAHFRYRSFIEAVDTEPPPVDFAAFEQELVIEPGPLVQALSKLPLNELLGLSVPAEFLQEGSWEDPPKVVIHKPEMQQQVAGATASVAALQVQPPLQPPQQRQQQARLPPHLQRQSHQPQPRQPQPQHPSIAHLQPPAGAAPQAAAAAVGSSSKPLQGALAAAKAAATKPDDDTDELLELLLAGDAPPPQQQAAAAAAATLAPLPAPARAGAGAAASSTVNPSAQLSKQAASASTAPAAAAPAAAPKQASAVFDDDLDALLGLGSTKGGSAAPAQGPPAAGTSKKQSLEDWLDGF